MTERECHYCGRLTWRGMKCPPNCRADAAWTRDHKVPKSEGGRGGDNLVVACQRCNMAKNSGDYSDFYAFASVVLRNIAPKLRASEAALAFRVWQIARLM